MVIKYLWWEVLQRWHLTGPNLRRCSIEDKRIVESNDKMLLKFLVDQQDGVIIDRIRTSTK